MAWDEAEGLGRRGRALAADVLACLRFYSRLPLGAFSFEEDPHGPPDAATVARVLPFAGALIGAVPAFVLVLALLLDLGPWLSAALCIASLTLVTGAMHDDGLADTADGFWGGATPERRLEIMRDSRIGSFGASALVLSFVLRIAALATLAERVDAPAAAGAVIVAAALSRTAGLIAPTLLAPTRPDGASHAFGRPETEDLWISFAIAGALALAVGLATGLPIVGVVLMACLAAGTGYLATRVSESFIGGQTGDVVGATQPLAEIACLLALLIVLAR